MGLAGMVPKASRIGKAFINLNWIRNLKYISSDVYVDYTLEVIY